jgi:hypothetical protein
MTPTAKNQAEQLMNEGIPLAQQLLREHGEFYPYALGMAHDGTIKHVAATDGTEKPKSKNLISILEESFQDDVKRRLYKAIALFLDVVVQNPNTNTKTDAIQIGLEHIDNYCVNIFVPYSKQSGSIVYDVIFATERTPTVFLHSK